MARSTKRTGGQIFLRFCFVAYCAWMLWLLFGQRITGTGEIAPLAERMNLDPFATIGRYWPLLLGEKGLTLRRLAVINLVGNVVMFVPLGFCLPRIFPRFRGFFRTFFAGLLMIVAVEAIQLLTALGVCDIDDLILNMVGITIGYPFSKIKQS